MAQPDFAYRTSSAMVSNDPWLPSHRWEQHTLPKHQTARPPARQGSIYNETYRNGMFDTGSNAPYRPQSVTYTPGNASSNNLPATAGMGNKGQFGRTGAGAGAGTGTGAEAMYPAYNPRSAPGQYPSPGPPSAGLGLGLGQQQPPYTSTSAQGWDHHQYQQQQQQQHRHHQHQQHQQGRFSPADSVDDIIASPSLSDYSLDAGSSTTNNNKTKPPHGRGRSQRRPSNRDEFDGPHQFLQPPPADYVAMQERELPHLPTNLLVQEQDSVLTQVNDRLSQCAYDFVAKYQFPIPLAHDMRPVARPADREWTEWVYLLKRLATKRRIPARILYNGQIKQFVTVLENSLEMRHHAVPSAVSGNGKSQARPLKDDRNILQLISAGIQVAKILKDAPAMDYLDMLYVSTEQQIHERSAAAAARFR
ncbi:hypothetical protein B0T19DRAFT_382966 [Cercophora scortea]|uniref:Uncharacterized protein n=1 Tax=Cercophora scortea TaxID=314031 RepID=A0AAE0IZ37_9PEZI|nr:hypothetical protein B0T19DRAFT_382966 [Cercophora scortea]